MMEIHRPSFHLGMINCFAEMVAVGVKRLAISPPLRPEEYREVTAASDTIVEGSGIYSYLEKSLLVTDLQSPGFTRGKWSILYFRDPAVLEEYLELKRRKDKLESSGAYTPDARKDISTRFMRLLSYPEEVIQRKLLSGVENDPFILEGS